MALTSGQAPDAVTTGSASSTDLPAWYQSYTQGLAGNASQLASNLNSQPLPGQSVAGFAPDTVDSFNLARQNVGSFQPLMQGAADTLAGVGSATTGMIDYAQGAVAGNAPDWANPGTASAYQNPAIGGMINNANNAAGSAGIQGWPASQGAFTNANGNNLINSAYRDASSANVQGWPAAQGSYTNNAGNNLVNYAQGAASGSAGSWTDPGVAAKYMSPYTSNVVDNISRIGTRNWEQNILPGIQFAAMGSGNFGSTRNAAQLGQAGAQVANDILGQQSTALQAGYTNAENQFNTDAGRAQAQQQMQATTAISGANASNALYGTALSGLNQANTTALNDAQLKANTGISGANASNAIYGTGLNGLNQANSTALNDAQLKANTAISGVNAANTAYSTAGNLFNQSAQLGQNQQQLQANTALTGASNLASIMNTNANSMGALAQTNSALQTKDAATLAGIGASEQAQNQAVLDANYNNATAARTDPWTQLSNAKSMVSGIQLPTSAVTASSAPANLYNPSAVAGGLSAYSSMMNALNPAQQAQFKALFGQA